MPQFDPAFFPTQIFWLAVSFLALYYIMVRHALPRVSEVLETRRSHIEHAAGGQEQFVKLITLSILCHKGFGIREIPVFFVNRKRGKSKMSASEIKGFLSFVIKKIRIRS